MTIKFTGHVEKMVRAGSGVRLTIKPEQRYCADEIEIDASHGETGAYKIGMPVEFTLIPRPDAEAPEFRADIKQQLAFLTEQVARYLDGSFGTPSGKPLRKEDLERALAVIGSPLKKKP